MTFLKPNAALLIHTEDGQQYYEQCLRTIEELRVGEIMLETGRREVVAKFESVASCAIWAVLRCAHFAGFCSCASLGGDGVQRCLA